ncbi:XisI protein [Aphanothece hegewaldii CCALA 016]|uniref:XisI protein n=1 Tax=Aphanothece hegewaldii CCALA 016 TaxID=2107694 RepID=A0A2T1LSF1_9CHRO|nr:XisI protein [Aphanothece hegewaldii]PSF32679.1 XisI protein [Aphanothece hegewaldii CCALA 016]
MDTLNNDRNIIEKLLQEYANYLGQEEQIQIELIFDRKGDHYLLVEIGWQNNNRIYGTLIHIDIIDGKVWIQQDGTEEGVADELVAMGIPKNRIVLGFKSIQRRKITEFAVS